jgi:HD-like signal output (HDOD) protein
VSKALLIPPRPELLIELQSLLQTQDPDINYLIKVIKQDVALYTILLSVANSPVYRRAHAITSIDQAVMILGTDKVDTLIQAVVVRSELQQDGLYEEFWSSATEVASICSVIAEQFILVNPELAYKVGMLHAAGTAVMTQNFPHYTKFIRQNGHLTSKELCHLERQTFATDHYQQGFELANHWNMDERAALAVRYQPITMAVIKDHKHLPSEVPILLALLKLAKNLSNEYHRYWQDKADSEENRTTIMQVLRYLHITDDDYKDLREQLTHQLFQSDAI